MLYALCFLYVFPVVAKEKESDSTAILLHQLDSFNAINNSFKYQTGTIALNSEVDVVVPKGYKFLSKKDADRLVYEIWGNPKGESEILGIIAKEDYSILSSDWALVLTYDNSGYIKDEDADDIDYKEMMSEIHKSEVDENKERVKNGYPTVHVLDWAITPYYDKKTNVLHWAKLMKFGDGEDTTLNYDVRVLGRRGLLSMNAVGTADQLNDIKEHVPEILAMAKFKKGSAYADFNPSMDKVAAYTIGGLVAGKLLAKAGLFALLLKNIKLVILAVIGAFGVFKKRIASFFNRKSAE